MHSDNFQQFVDAYFACALWSSLADVDGAEFLEEVAEAGDIAPESREAQEEECRDFFDANLQALTQAVQHPGYTWASAGHDFWLTRCGHGAGFWDRGLPGGIGDTLSEAARVYGNIDPYLGDDGKVRF